MITSKLYSRTNLGCQYIFFIKPIEKARSTIKKKKNVFTTQMHRHLKPPKNVKEILEVFCNET